MSQGYDNTNKGTMFKNDRKLNDRHPDYKGSLNIEGVEYWVSGWIKTAGPNAKNPGSKFLSLSVEMKEAFQAQAPAPKPKYNEPSQNLGDFDDDIPF